MSTAAPLYVAVMLELERRRQQLGVGMERFSEFAGLPDRAYAKMLWPTAEDRRQASWESVQRVVDALHPDGFDVVIKPRKGPQLDILSAKFKARFGVGFHDRRVLREHMAELGRNGRAQQLAKTTPEQRSKIARKAAKARYRKRKLDGTMEAVVFPPTKLRRNGD